MNRKIKHAFQSYNVGPELAELMQIGDIEQVVESVFVPYVYIWHQLYRTAHAIYANKKRLLEEITEVSVWIL